MALVTLASLVARAKRRADMVNSSFLSDSEWKELILSGVQRLRQRLHRGGQEWERLTAEMDTIPGQALYDLPADFFRLISLLANERPVQAGSVVAGTWGPESSDAVGWIALYPFEMAELHQLLNRTDGAATTVRYRLRGIRDSVGETAPVLTPVRKVELRPTPRVSFTVRAEYLPTTILNTSDSAPIDGLDGFEEIPVLEAAIYALQKEESSSTHLEEWLARQEAHLNEIAPAQDAGRPERVVDVYAQQHDDTIGWGPRRRGFGWWP